MDKDHEKGLLCKKLLLEIFLDNKHTILEHIPKEHNPVLFDRFNEYSDKPFARVKSWSEFYDLIKNNG